MQILSCLYEWSDVVVYVDGLMCLGSAITLLPEVSNYTSQVSIICIK